MKSKYLVFPLAVIVTSSAIAGTYTWRGTADSNWTNSTNWELSSPSVPGDLFPAQTPTPGTIYADALTVNNWAYVVDQKAFYNGAVYNPGAGFKTTFTAGRCVVIGVGHGPASSPPQIKGKADLTITSGTIAASRPTAPVGGEPFMANRTDSTLLINGGALELTDINGRDFNLIHEGLKDSISNEVITSTITITSGSLSCNALNLYFDSENDPATSWGNGVVNLEGTGVLALTRFTRTHLASPGQTSFTINLNGGTLRCRNSNVNLLNALADTQTIVKSGGAVIDTNTFSSTIAEVLEHDPALGATLDGGLTKNGVGSLTLSGASTFTGPVTVNAGSALATPSRLLLAANTAAGTGQVTLADSYAEIQVNNTRNIANAIVIANQGAEKTFLLPSPGGGNFAGATFSGPVTINDTDIDHFRVRADDNCFLTLSGKISGPGGIFKFQNGTVILSNAANDFTGGARITAGGFSFSNGALGTSGSVLMDGGTLSWSAGNPQDISSRLKMVSGKTATFNLAEVTTPTYAISNVTFASAIGNDAGGNSTTAALVKIGNGTLTLTQPSTYSGGTTLTQGTLEFPNNGLGTTGAVTMNNGLLRWATGNTQDLSSRIVMVNGRTASFSTNGNDVTFGSAIGNATTASFTKTNTLGTLTLSGASTYSGTTTVGGGTLKIGSPTSLGVSGLQTTTAIGTTVSSGATLDLNGTSGINEVITLSGTGVGNNGALVNSSGTPASTSNLIAGFTVPALGSGSGFSTPPAVGISGTGTGASATASLGVTTASFDVNVSGDRVYTVAPTVTIAGGGTGATATAILTDGYVTGITVTSAGSGFTTAPTAVISGGTSTGTSVTTFTGNAASFTVGGLTLTNAGSGYTSAPTVTLDGSPGTVTTVFSSVILAANSNIGGSGNTTIDGVVSQTGGTRALTKVGIGTVTLNGANTYTGETKVDAGTLAINTDDTLANAAAVRIANMSLLELGFVGTDTVDRLFLNGVEQPSGTWGSLASSADNKTARITGTGILDVTNGAAPALNFDAWASSQVPPVTGGPNGDSNNDGVPNLIQYALVDGGERGVLSGNTITFSKRLAPYGSDVTYSIQTSTDLVGWGTPVSGVTQTSAAISFLFTPGTPTKNFARLKVVQVP